MQFAGMYIRHLVSLLSNPHSYASVPVTYTSTPPRRNLCCCQGEFWKSSCKQDPAQSYVPVLVFTRFLNMLLKNKGTSACTCTHAVVFAQQVVSYITSYLVVELSIDTNRCFTCHLSAQEGGTFSLNSPFLVQCFIGYFFILFFPLLKNASVLFKLKKYNLSVMMNILQSHLCHRLNFFLTALLQIYMPGRRRLCTQLS